MKKAKPKPPAFSVEFGKRMKAVRILAGYSTVREGADALQLDEGRYGRWERGERDPDVNSIHRICRVYGTTPNVLFGYKEGEREGT